jgi:hypothetical protein
LFLKIRVNGVNGINGEELMFLKIRVNGVNGEELLLVSKVIKIRVNGVNGEDFPVLYRRYREMSSKDAPLR